MKRLVCALGLPLVACGAADPGPRPDPAWVADVRARAHPLASIDVDAGNDADLAFLNEVLAHRRIVELGESTHGAAQYSRAKTRLVKYLHEQLGYDVLVWESSMLAAYLVDQELRRPPRRSAPGWTRSSCSETSVWRTYTRSRASKWTGCSTSRRSSLPCSSIPEAAPALQIE